MHEVGLMQNILDRAVKRAQQEGAHQIDGLHVRLGADSGVVPDSLEFAFEVVKKGTIAQSARLQTELIPLVCYCANCNLEFEPTDLLYECPECHQSNCEVKQGQEFELAFLDVS